MKQTIVIISILILSVSFLKAQGQVITKDWTYDETLFERTYAFQRYYDIKNSTSMCPILTDRLSYKETKLLNGQVMKSHADFHTILRNSLTKENLEKISDKRTICSFICDVKGNTVAYALMIDYEEGDIPLEITDAELTTLTQYLMKTKHIFGLSYEAAEANCLIHLMFPFRKIKM